MKNQSFLGKTKKTIQLNKIGMNSIMRIIILFSVFILASNASAQCIGGKISIDTSRCRSSNNTLATMKLINHTKPGAGITYQWQSDNGAGFTNIVGGSTTDTQDFNPGILGRRYRCIVNCGALGTAFSDTLLIQYLTRDIFVQKKLCSRIAGGNDSLILALVTSPPANDNLDSAVRKNYLWRVSSTGGNVWTSLPNSNSSTMKVRFTTAEVIYNAYISVCPLSNPVITKNNNTTGGLPNNISFGSIGAKNLALSSSTVCPSDSIRIGMNGDINDSILKYRWQVSNTFNGPYIDSPQKDSFLLVKVVPNQPKYYRVQIRLCDSPFTAAQKSNGDTFVSADVHTTSPIRVWPNLGNFTATYDCNNEVLLLDYSNRDSVRNVFKPQWVVSNNDSLTPVPFSGPVDSVKFFTVLQNKTDKYYKIYNRLCPGGKIFDSTFFLRTFLDVDSGQLLIDTIACPNDSVYLQLINYNSKSSLPLFSQWEWLGKDMPFWETYTRNPQTNSTASLRMPQGWTSYRRTTAFCPGRYAYKVSSSIARSFLPFQTVFDSFNCSTALNVGVLNDTPRVVDHRGTRFRRGPRVFQWLNNAGQIAGATLQKLSIASSAKTLKYRRVTGFCPSGSTNDTTVPSVFGVNKPNQSNGRADIMDEVCLGYLVRIHVVDGITKGTDSFVTWQESDDEFVWRNMVTPDANRDTITVRVTNITKYYRKLTLWCPNGIIDSSKSLPVVYNKDIGCETFNDIIITGRNGLYNCWRFSNACASWNPRYGNAPIWSRPGKAGLGMRHRGTPQEDMPPLAADGKLYMPAYYLERGKIYRVSFFHKEDGGQNLCWDSLYMTWGYTFDPCENTNKFGDILTNFKLGQWNKYWADFIPQDNGIYYLCINYRESTAFPPANNITFDDVCLKVVDSCQKAKTVSKGRTFAPSKIIQRSEEPDKAPLYDKANVTHQYCLWDTIMLTYQESVYDNADFDYFGMKYQIWKKREDADWKVTDTFFKPYLGDKNICHIPNRTDYQTANVLVNDTNTWYKIVATCAFDNKDYSADSLLVNGTHSVPWCEDWEDAEQQGNQDPNVTSQMPPRAGNSAQIIGSVPSFSACPTCWGAFPQLAPPAPNPGDISLCAVTLPYRNFIGAAPQNPQLWPDNGFVGNTVVATTDSRAMSTAREMVVFPAVRLYKGRGYRITVRWTDNRTSLGSSAPNFNGNATQRMDTMALIFAKGNRALESMNNFVRTNRVGRPEINSQSNIIEVGGAKYRTFWRDFTPTDTATYSFALELIAGGANGGSYRFYMDYFCIDTMALDTGCGSTPKFENPLVVRASPNGMTWRPGDSKLQGTPYDWCVGNRINMELSHEIGANTSWSAGWKIYWERNQNQASPNWVTIDSGNHYSYVISNKFQMHRIRITNACGLNPIYIGPIDSGSLPGSIPWREGFDPESNTTFPACWTFFNRCRIQEIEIPNTFGQSARSYQRYLELDYLKSGNTAACPSQTNLAAIPPAFLLTPASTYRFSFWYRDNGISQPTDSLRVGWSLDRTSSAFPQANRLVNRVNNDIMRDFKTRKWSYYTTQFTPPIDTAYHFKFQHNIATKRVYMPQMEDFYMKRMVDTDLLVIAVDSPDYKCGLTANATVKVQIMNIGFKTVSNIPVHISSNQAPSVSAVFAGPLVTNQIGTVYIPAVNLLTPGDNNIQAWTDHPNEQDRYDDTFKTTLFNITQWNAPTDTVDSVCINTNIRKSEGVYGSVTRWYSSPTVLEPFSLEDTLRFNNIQRDTCFYRSLWSGDVCYTNPNSTADGPVVTYVAGTRSLYMRNLSRDTLIIDTATIWANSAGSITLTLEQFGQQISGPVTRNIFTTGRQRIPVKLTIPPGTDYYLRMNSTALLATLPSTGTPSFSFFQRGCPQLLLYIDGDAGSPAAAPGAYSYLFNMRIVKNGCETPRIPICFKTVTNPTFSIYDTNRVCSQPVYQVCGPTAPAWDSYTYQWATNDITQCVPADGTKNFKLTVTNAFGCTATNNRTITVDPSPIFNLGNDTSFCDLTTLALKTGLNSSNNVVNWERVGDSLGFASGMTYPATKPGTYIATAINKANFCPGRDTISIAIIAAPSYNLGGDTLYCGTSAILGLSLPSAGHSYVWGTHTATRNISASGTWWVRGTNLTTGCSNSDTVKVTIVPPPVVNLGSDRNVCGSSTQIAAPIGDFSYLWSTGSAARVITVSATGSYIVTVTSNTTNCFSIDTIRITFLSLPVFSLGPDTALCATKLQLNGPIAGGMTYQWTGPNGRVGSGSALLADTTGSYCLTVNNGCYTYSDCRFVELRLPPDSAFDLLPISDTGCRQVAVTATSKPLSGTVRWGPPIASNVATSNTQLIKRTGSYSVTLTNQCGTATKSTYIKIDTTPTANFTPLYPTCMSVGITNTSQYATSYEWEFGDGMKSVEENPLHVYQNEGNYIVTLKVFNSCGTAFKSQAITRREVNCNTSSIATALEKANIVLYPNPTKNHTTLMGAGIQNGNYTISIRNILGQEVSFFDLKVTNNVMEINLDVSKYAAGDYLLQIVNDTDAVVKKLQILK